MKEKEVRLQKRKELGLKPGDRFSLAQLWSQKLITGGVLPYEVRTSRRLSMGAKVMYSALAEREATQSQVFPSVRRLAEDCAISEAQARRYVHELSRNGFLDIESRWNQESPTEQTSNLYTFRYASEFDESPSPKEPRRRRRRRTATTASTVECASNPFEDLRDASRKRVSTRTRRVASLVTTGVLTRMNNINDPHHRMRRVVRGDGLLTLLRRVAIHLIQKLY